MGRNFIEREVFLDLLRGLRRIDGTEFQDLDTVYGDMSRLIVAWLATTQPEQLEALYNELGWKGKSRTMRQVHLAAKRWLEERGREIEPAPAVQGGTPTQLADLKQQAWLAFQRDLPQLYAQRPGQWVAYRAARQVGFADQKHLLYQQCFDQGLRDEEFVIFCIEPQETEITLGPMVLD